LGKTEVRPLMLQYKDHHTAYGPLAAGAHGLTFISLRNKTGDSHPIYLSKPGYREKLKPSKRRNWVSSNIALATEAVLQFRKDIAWEPVYDPANIEDEMSAHIVRLGASMSAMVPDPQIGGGTYLFVANGDLEIEGNSLPRWSMVFVEAGKDAVEMRAGHKGLEALVMQFPKDDE